MMHGHLNVKNRYQPLTLTLLIPFFLPFPTSSPHNFHFTIIGQYFVCKILHSVCIVNWGIRVGRVSQICFPPSPPFGPICLKATLILK